MLVIEVRLGERVSIGDEIVIVPSYFKLNGQRIRRGDVTLAIEAPKEMKILRGKWSESTAPKGAVFN